MVADVGWRKPCENNEFSAFRCADIHAGVCAIVGQAGRSGNRIVAVSFFYGVCSRQSCEVVCFQPVP